MCHCTCKIRLPDFRPIKKVFSTKFKEVIGQADQSKSVSGGQWLVSVAGQRASIGHWNYYGSPKWLALYFVYCIK